MANQMISDEMNNNLDEDTKDLEKGKKREPFKRRHRIKTAAAPEKKETTETTITPTITVTGAPEDNGQAEEKGQCEKKDQAEEKKGPVDGKIQWEKKDQEEEKNGHKGATDGKVQAEATVEDVEKGQAEGQIHKEEKVVIGQNEVKVDNIENKVEEEKDTEEENVNPGQSIDLSEEEIKDTNEAEGLKDPRCKIAARAGPSPRKPQKFKHRASKQFKSKPPKRGVLGFGDEIPGMEGLGTDITVVCPWEAFSHLELHELAQFGII